MIHIVVVSHGDLGKSLIASAEMIAGSLEGVSTVSLLPNENLDTFGEKLDTHLESLGDQEILLLVDLFGGTPCNVAARAMARTNLESVSGANLPMLLEVVLSGRVQVDSVKELAAMAEVAGRKSVKNIREILEGA
jgi:mannose/fructose/sorbose-specific phosphotransferase system IIA component